MTRVAGDRHPLWVVLAFAVIALPYIYRLGDVPLIKVDEVWGAQPSWEIWTHGRFALPAFTGQLHQDVATFFHPPGYYLVNAPFVGLLRPSTWSVRVAPTLFALLAFVALYHVLRRLLAGAPNARPLALAGVALAAWNPLTFALSRHGRPETWILLLATCAVLLVQRDPDGAPSPAPSARATWFPAFAAGLVSGYAIFSHYWAFVLPGVLALHLVLRRAWKALAWYALGTSVFVAVTAGWILVNRADFMADLMWHRSSLLTHTAGGYFEKRFADHVAILRDPRASCTWWLEAALVAALLLPGARPIRWRTLGLLAALHLLLVLFPRPSAYYTVAIVLFCAGAIPLALARTWEPATTGARRGLAAALALVIAVPTALLGYMLWRDKDASYDAAFRPLREAVDRADPAHTGVTVGSEIQYFAFWDRPYLIRWNPWLWRGADDPDSVLARWRSSGVRFVLTSSLMPDPTKLSPYPPAADRALVDRLRAEGRTLASARTWYYGEPDHKYEDATVEVIDIGASR